MMTYSPPTLTSLSDLVAALRRGLAEARRTTDTARHETEQFEKAWRDQHDIIMSLRARIASLEAQLVAGRIVPADAPASQP